MKGMGGIGEKAFFRDRVGNAIRRRGVAAASLALATALATAAVANAEDWANFADDEERAALEEAFFETLGRCESPLLVERNEAEDALFGRFADFESIWQDRRFLTNGEIGAEARRRFELAEARYREKAFAECVAAFATTFESDASEVAEGKNREKRKEGERNESGGVGEIDEVGKSGEVGEVGESGETLRGRVRLRWDKPLRIVYLSPDWSAFERRDADGKRWRPSGRFSVPELAPEFDASELTLETTWERVADEDASPELENKGLEENREDGEVGEDERDEEKEVDSEDKTTVVGVWEGLVGGDFRVWTLPLGRVAVKNASLGENGESKEIEEDAGKREVASTAETSGPNVDLPNVFQSGDAVATVGETSINENGETTARVRFEFAEAFDAFDSHRVWFDRRDFELIIDDGDDKANIVVGIGGLREVEKTKKMEKAEKAEKTQEKTNEEETGADGRRWTAIRWRVRERSERGVLFELDFPNDAALREAVAEGRARLCCRIPRFFFWTRFEVAGVEKSNDGDAFNDFNGDTSGNASKIRED